MMPSDFREMNSCILVVAMKERYCFLWILLLPCFAWGQEYWCAAKDDSSYVLSMEIPFKNRTETYLPVVIHFVVRDLSLVDTYRAAALHQIDILNEDFAGKNENVRRLSESFKNLVSNTGLRFCLAKTDPGGNYTTGITITQTTIPDIGLKTGEQGRGLVYYDQLGGKTGWDASRYINIWVCEIGGSFLGSTTLPGKANFPEERGIVIDIEYFSALGAAAKVYGFSKGHTLTHEMGHYLGLRHIWGTNSSGCSDDDGIDDTPVADGPYFGCPAGRQLSCGVSNMYQNFMDLTDDRCLAAFTHGQSDAMHATIQSFYPELLTEGSCLDLADNFQSWYDQLVWAYDPISQQYLVYVENKIPYPIQIEIFNLDGRLMKSGKLESYQTYILPTKDFAPGMYVARIGDGDFGFSRKIVVY